MLDRDVEEYRGATVQLPERQWRWLEERSRRKMTRSRSLELRLLIAAAMEQERTQAAA